MQNGHLTNKSGTFQSKKMYYFLKAYIKPVYNEKYLKARIKYYSGKINTNIQNNKIPKESSQFICLSVSII